MWVHDRLLRFARRSLPVLVCALAAHAAVYGSLVPSDSMHGYMGVYEAVVGVTWLMALAVLVVVATTFVLLERSCGGLIRAFLAGRATLPRVAARISTPRSAARRGRRRSLLADRRGSRAPPALVV